MRVVVEIWNFFLLGVRVLKGVLVRVGQDIIVIVSLMG